MLGAPVGHSLSPALHRAAYAALGLDWEYAAIECDAGALAGVLDALDASYVGVSLTMPLKVTVLALLDEVVGVAATVGAVNTVLFGRGQVGPGPSSAAPVGSELVGSEFVGGELVGGEFVGGDSVGGDLIGRELVARLQAGGALMSPEFARPDRRRVGHNTDVPGMLAALREAGVSRVHSALVLGGGATACSALAALRALGVEEVEVMVRNRARTAGLLAVADRLGVRPTLLPWGPVAAAELVVSTVPAGAADGVRPEASTVFDVVYAPWPTTFARAALSVGARVLGGLDLLVHQAALQVELMTGRPAPLAAMRAAGESALRAG